MIDLKLGVTRALAGVFSVLATACVATSWVVRSKSCSIVLVPAGTPQPIVGKLHGAFVKVVAYPDTLARFKTLGLNTIAGTPAGFAAFLQGETVKWGKVIKAAEIRIE